MSDAGSPSSSSPAAHGDPQPSIADVQARILEQLQASRAVLTARSGSGSLPKDELAEVLEELSHSTALLATVKRDLDGMFSRLRRTRAALAAAFPQHAMAPRRVVPHDDEEDAAPERQRRQQQQQQQQEEGQLGQPLATGEDGQPGRQQQQHGQQDQGQQQEATLLGQGGEETAGAEAAGAAAAEQEQEGEQPQDSAAQQAQQQGFDAPAEQRAAAEGETPVARAAAQTPPDAPPDG